MSRDYNGAAGVAEARALLEGFIPQPASQKTSHERIPSAEYVMDLDAKAWSQETVLDIVGHWPRKYHAALRAALAHNGRRGARAHDFQRRQGRLNSTEDANFLFGADH